jgi:hypothetical protein
MEYKMEKRFEFVDRTLHLIRELLENHLPKEGTLDEMVIKRDKLLLKFMHKGD